ncbi:MAG: type-F conjugative transfer system secretin TraK [Pseudomonadota bacterium]
MKSSSYKIQYFVSVSHLFTAALLLIVCLVATSGNSFAANKIAAIELTNNPKESLKVKISQLSPTRIGFGGYPIAEVIGDENKYKIISDSSGQNVFITPKAEVGTIIPVTIITSNNMAQDLLLEVMGDELMPQSILITIPKKKQNDSPYGRNSSVYKASKAESALMLKAMINDENRGEKYYVTASARKLFSPSLPHLKILQYKTYRFGDLTGANLVITNNSKEVVYLTEEIISTLFRGVELVTLNDGLLSKGTSTKAFVITRRGSL